MLESPADCAELFEYYGVTHVFLSSHERRAYAADEAWFEANAEKLFAAGSVAIYALSPEGSGPED